MKCNKEITLLVYKLYNWRICTEHSALIWPCYELQLLNLNNIFTISYHLAGFGESQSIFRTKRLVLNSFQYSFNRIHYSVMTTQKFLLMYCTFKSHNCNYISINLFATYSQRIYSSFVNSVIMTLQRYILCSNNLTMPRDSNKRNLEN